MVQMWLDKQEILIFNWFRLTTGSFLYVYIFHTQTCSVNSKLIWMEVRKPKSTYNNIVNIIYRKCQQKKVWSRVLFTNVYISWNIDLFSLHSSFYLIIFSEFEI